MTGPARTAGRGDEEQQRASVAREAHRLTEHVVKADVRVRPRLRRLRLPDPELGPVLRVAYESERPAIGREDREADARPGRQLDAPLPALPERQKREPR